MASLRSHGLEENTLVFFISDNGGPTGVTEADNTPLRGAKGQVYEGGIRVPFVARWKGRLTPGSYSQPVSSLDLFPTICAAAGVMSSATLDGVNLLPFLTGAQKGAPHERLFWRTGGGVLYAVREGLCDRTMVRSLRDRIDELNVALTKAEQDAVATVVAAVVWAVLDASVRDLEDTLVA